MIRKLTANGALREDMLQEALIHLWLAEIGRPGQTRSWYLQSCKFHLLHYLSAGRSIDSSKRRSGQLLLVEDDPTPNGFHEHEDSSGSVLASVSARDIMAQLSPQLSRQERAVLECFADGFGLREIGRKLKISHTMVIRHRRKIAALLRRLETESMPINGSVRANGSSRGKKPSHKSVNGHKSKSLLTLEAKS